MLLLPIFFPRQIFLPVHPYIHLGGRNSAAHDAGNLKPGPDLQSCHGILKDAGRNSSIKQRAHKHVAAHAGKTFKVGYTHRRNSRFFIIGNATGRQSASNQRPACALLESLFSNSAEGSLVSSS